MDAKEKIEYVRNQINEVSQISPSGPISLYLYTVSHPDNEEWTILTLGEQKRILKKLEEDGEIENLEFDEKRSAFFEVVSREKENKKYRRSNILSHIKNIDQFIQHRELFQKFFSILGDFRNIKPKHKYTFPTEEKNDDLIQLLIDLEIVEYDWDKIKKQTHRAVGNRIIEFSFLGDKIISLNNRVSGKGGLVRKEALELISKDIGDRFTFNKIIEIFNDIGVPQSMFIQDTKWRAVFYILSFYTTSAENQGILTFLKILESFVHPLMFLGDEEQAKQTEEKYNKWLKYDRIWIDGGKGFLGPTEEEITYGADDWVNSDGKYCEPKSYVFTPERLAKLYVLWNQIVLIVGVYEDNQSLDKKELEKLYLELISKVEEIIEGGMVGNLKELYKRPFTSLSTANIEARSKNAESPLELVGLFLLAITALEPNATEVGKAMENNSDITSRVALITQAIGGEKLNISKLSYPQALFMLKMDVRYIFNILEAVCNGYINIADMELNTKYVLLVDDVNNILDRKDFEELKKLKPDYLLENLFQGVDEIDTWWECGGQSSIMSFVGDIETAWIRTGQQVFPISISLNKQFIDTEEIISKHTKYKQAKWEQITKNIDENINKGVFAGNQKIENETQTETQSFWITKNKNGDYMYDGNPVYIKSKNADYVVIFDVVYSIKPKGGKIKYKEIIEQCKKRNKKVKEKSILRALTGKDANLFKYVKELKQKPVYNISLFVAMQDGKEIEFNNKK